MTDSTAAGCNGSQRVRALVARTPAFSVRVLGKDATGVQLQATASGLSAATSASFNVTTNSDWIFRGVFETCFP